MRYCVEFWVVMMITVATHSPSFCLMNFHCFLLPIIVAISEWMFPSSLTEGWGSWLLLRGAAAHAPRDGASATDCSCSSASAVNVAVVLQW
ncbi:hypothetical protein COO60DRAFT_1492726 [Scenedesmus sp. NREL 46B-D3]|nr:hypothetical protein COO60DRAFT_1492726 [Scenedesmus sp. NREL 46B-D3]